MKKLLDAHAKTADERQALSERLEKEAVERRKIEKTKGMLLGKLQAMEAKLIQASRTQRERQGAACCTVAAPCMRYNTAQQLPVCSKSSSIWVSYLYSTMRSGCGADC